MGNPDYSDESRTKSRYFSCSELLNELEMKNPGLKRDDSIRSSIKSNSRQTPRRPNSMVSNSMISQIVPPVTARSECPSITPTNELENDISGEMKSPFEISRSPTENEIMSSALG